jgi:hypothetical protein
VMDECVEAGAEGDGCLQCNQQFAPTREPRILQCLHRVCSECAEELDQVECVACEIRSPTEPDHATIAELRAMASSCAPAPVCCGDSCEEPASLACRDCEGARLRCDECHAFKHRKGTAKSHTSIPIAEHLSTQGTATTLLPGTLFCRAHIKRECEFFCRDYQELVCAVCAATTHKDHGCVVLDEELSSSREVVMAAAKPAVQAFSSVAEARARCQQLRLELDQHARKGSDEIDQMFRTIQRACITRREEFKASFEAEVARKVGLFDACIERLNDCCEHSQEGLRVVKRMLDRATPAQLLGVRKFLVEGLERLDRRDLATDPGCTEVVAVLPRSLDDVLEGIRRVGEIADVGNTPIQPLVGVVKKALTKRRKGHHEKREKEGGKKRPRRKAEEENGNPKKKKR